MFFLAAVELAVDVDAEVHTKDPAQIQKFSILFCLDGRLNGRRLLDDQYWRRDANGQFKVERTRGVYPSSGVILN